MSRPIDADDLPNRKFVGVATWTPTEADSWQRGWNDAIDTIVKVQPTIDAVPVVRCRDCKHRPIPTKPSYRGGEWLDFPDSVCPCQCEDIWYSWNPDSDWFCGNGERKEDEQAD